MSPLPQLVILDRDGVINHDSKDFIKSPAEFRPIEGSMAAIGRLTQAGIPVAIASNQSGLGRGYFNRQTLYAIHKKLRRLAALEGGKVDRIVYCPHLPDSGCRCRKPEPELFERLLKRFNVDGKNAIGFGDSARDLQAANRAGVPAKLVRTGNGERAMHELNVRREDTAQDLADAVERLFNGEW